jgi:hypothetical protein
VLRVDGWARHVAAHAGLLSNAVDAAVRGLPVLFPFVQAGWLLLLFDLVVAVAVTRSASPSSSVRSETESGSDRRLVFSVFGAGGFGLIVRPGPVSNYDDLMTAPLWRTQQRRRCAN